MSHEQDVDRDELRAAVRAVLRDVLPGLAAGGPAAAVDGAKSRVEAVRVVTDADLAAVVSRVLELAADPSSRADLVSGRLRFVLADALRGAVAATAPAADVGVHRVEHGAVTERRVAAAAAAGARLLVGRGAVLTPLARDKARALGVVVEKER
jgi:hypothetical protein